MRSNTARAAAGLVVVALAIVLFVVFQGGDDKEGGSTAPTTTEQPTTTGTNGNGDGDATEDPPSPPPAPPVPTIRLEGDALAGEVEQIDVSTGETVRFRVVADQPWDFHIHGFDVEGRIQPGKPLEISFPAEIEGAYEAEVHSAAAEFPIAEINVSPS
jgi:hypothetical protein